MIRSRSPPGVCRLTVRAGSGILKIFIAFFHPGSGVNVAALHRGESRRTVQLGLLTFRDKEISKKFSQNFTTFSPTL